MIVSITPHSAEFDNRPWVVEFKNQGATANIAILGDEPDTAYLYCMYSVNRRKGEASALLKEIEGYCQDSKITLIIEAEAYDTGEDGIPDNDTLKVWYEKNGAHFIGNTDGGIPLLLLGYDSDQSE